MIKHGYQKFSYDEYRPSLSALQLNPEIEFYIDPITKKPQRNVFYNVQFQDSEYDLIKQVSQSLQPELEKCPKWWSLSDSLQFLYKTNLDPDKAVVAILTHWEWIQQRLANFCLHETSAELLSKGEIRQFGRDHHQRPVIYIKHTTNLKQKLGEEVYFKHLEEALLFTLIVVKKYMLLPRCIEKYIIVFDLEGHSVGPYMTKISLMIARLTQEFFYGHLFKLMFVNLSKINEILMKTLMNYFSEFYQNGDNFLIFEQTETTNRTLKNHIDQDNLFKQFGGNQDLPIVNWPPTLRTDDSLAKFPEEPLTINQLLLKGIKPFCFFDYQDLDIFEPQQNRSKVNGQDQIRHGQQVVFLKERSSLISIQRKSTLNPVKLHQQIFESRQKNNIFEMEEFSSSKQFGRTGKQINTLSNHKNQAALPANQQNQQGWFLRTILNLACCDMGSYSSSSQRRNNDLVLPLNNNNQGTQNQATQKISNNQQQDSSYSEKVSNLKLDLIQESKDESLFSKQPQAHQQKDNDRDKERQPVRPFINLNQVEDQY